MQRQAAVRTYTCLWRKTGHPARVLRAVTHRKNCKSMHKIKAYVVEDSPVIRESLIAALEELAPVTVVGTAEDEFTAVQWLSQPNNHFDLVIVDIFLKSGSGLGVLKATNALLQRHNVAVFSNYATTDIRRKCLELGADRVFDKSNEIDDLITYCGRLAAGETGNGALSALN